jgi:hypothetical protein
VERYFITLGREEVFACMKKQLANICGCIFFNLSVKIIRRKENIDAAQELDGK